MAEEVYRIEIPIHASDNTDPAISTAQKKVYGFEKVVDRVKQKTKGVSKMELVANAVDKASATLTKIEARAKAMAGKTYSVIVGIKDMITRPLKSIASFMTSTIGMLTAGAGIAGGIVIPMTLAGNYEQTEIAFATMIKSGEKAKSFLEDVSDFADKTPFEFPELVDSTKLLMAFGFEADKTLGIMKTIGDTSSGLGAGSVGIERVTRALGQMKAKGRLQTEELLQLQELGVPAAQILQEELGLTAEQVANIGKEGVAAGKGIDALLRGMDKRFGGMMDQQSSTAMGLISTLQDTIKNKLLRRWGEGLWSGLKPQLSKIVDWIDQNKEQIRRWGDEFKKIGENISVWVTSKIEQVRGRISSMVNSSDWKNATTLSDKMRLVWDKIISEPFEEWWNGKGKSKVIKVAENIGHGLGGAIGGFLSSALGIAADPDKAMKESPFLSAGTTAGKAFLDAFLEAFEADKIANKLLGAIKGVAKDAATVLPGGEEASSTGWLSAILLTALGIKGGKGIAKLAKGGASIFKGAKGVAGWFSGGAKGASAAAETAAAAGAAAEAVSSTAKASKVAGIFGKAGKGLKGIPVLGAALGLLGSGATIAAAAPENRARETAGEAGSWIGSIATGAALGAAGGAIGGSIVPGAGTAVGGAIGAVVGGIGGAIGGEAFTEWLFDQKDSVAAWAGDVGKKFGDTWAGIKQGASNAKSWVQDKWNTVSGWFGENVGTPVSNAFINTTNTIVGYADMAREGISNALAPVVGWIDSNVWQPIKSGASAAGQWISDRYTEAKTWVSDTWSSFSGWFSESVWTPVQDAATAAGDWISTKIGEAKAWATDAWSGVSGWFGNNVWQPIKDGAASAASWVSEKLSGVKDWLGGKWSDFTSWVAEATSGARERGEKITGITPHANGGMLTRPHMGLIAEAGPEAIIPLSSARRDRGISLWEQVGQMFGMSHAYADGGLAGDIDALPKIPAGMPKQAPAAISLVVQANPSYKIESAANAQDILRIIKENNLELADELLETISKILPAILKNTVVVTEG